MNRLIVLMITGALCAFTFAAGRDNGRRAEVLFLGQKGTIHATWLATKLFKSGINLTYTENAADLSAAGLSAYDGLIVNTSTPLTPARDVIVRQFVASGKGLVILNKGAGAFKNAAWAARSGTEGKGRIFYAREGAKDEEWKERAFLGKMRDSISWALGEEVRQQIIAADIPDVDIYNSDTIADYTKRYLVPKMQEALSPGASNKLTQVPADFEIKLFAAEPDITKPIAMTWDEKGRLWIVESVDYPNAFTEIDSAANDRIKICEDTDGDGKADKFTIFADSLNIPTSIVLSNGGAIVSMAPYFLFLKDTNGDDKADVREVMFTGWGKQDTHAGPSNLLYGFNNKIWGVTGYSGFDGTINGKPLRFPMGVYSFRPDGSDFNFLAKTSNNTWGLGLTEDNHVFISTANNTHSAYYSMPASLMQRALNGAQPLDPIQKIDGHYDVHAMTPNLRQVDVVGGFTSATGHHFYTARSFPKAYWNRIAFINEPTVRLVHNAVIEPDGAGFKEKDGWNLVASSDEWFGPVQAQTGPDGAVWVADWYNFIIQHNVFVKEQAPREMVLPFTDQPHGKGNAFESNLRDSAHGRIYRVVYKKAKPYQPMQLKAGDVPGLLAALKSDNMFWRMTAQRLLVEGGHKEAIPELYRIIQDLKVDEVGLNSPAVHALWTLQGLGAYDAASMQVMARAMKHPAAGVRKAAVEVLKEEKKGLSSIIQSNIHNDRNLQVRLAVFRSLADYPASKETGALLFKAALNSQNAKDPWLNRALFAAAVTHEEGFLAAAAGGTPNAFAKNVIKSLEQSIYNVETRTIMQNPPDITGKELIMKATVGKRREREVEGLIMAHGNQQNGYGLYIRDGKLAMVINQQGKAYEAATAAPLPEKMEVEARLLKTGEMKILVDGKEAAKGKAPGLFTVPAPVALRAGEEQLPDQRVADYAGRFNFIGQLQNVSLQLDRPVKKTIAAAAEMPGIVIDLKVVKDIMQYDKKRITVKAGQKVTIRLENPDGMQHNLLIIKPGTLPKVGAAADAMVRDPQASKMQYVPKVPEVLWATKLVSPGETVSLRFTAPSKAGDYPFVCTFPGHWRGMNGIMQVIN
ncbi:PVC-type heme-binding CxxCH protein [Chitinophaga sp. YIM B06452]|uniref:PVC-type heme-binding CxxCH protein n=1 Tax=Chitinophaga sp. YIM B06452 TaxID=3082158 RepID=UPI0031FF2C86